MMHTRTGVRDSDAHPTRSQTPDSRRAGCHSGRWPGHSKRRCPSQSASRFTDAPSPPEPESEPKHWQWHTLRCLRVAGPCGARAAGSAAEHSRLRVRRCGRDMICCKWLQVCQLRQPYQARASSTQTQGLLDHTHCGRSCLKLAATRQLVSCQKPWCFQIGSCRSEPGCSAA